jgi:hypothetical protein
LVTSDGKIFIDGKPACSKCQRRPKRWNGRRWQSYCAECHREDRALRRAGKIEVLLTREEWETVKAMRIVAGGRRGRHRR